MIKALENEICMETLRELGMFRLEEREQRSRVTANT